MTGSHAGAAGSRKNGYGFISAALRALPAADLFVVRLRLHRRREPVLAEIHARRL